MSSSQELQIILKAIDQASGALGSVKGQLQALDSTAKSTHPSVKNAGDALNGAGTAASGAAPKLQQASNAMSQVGKSSTESGSKLGGLIGVFGKVGLGVAALSTAAVGAVGVMGVKFDSFKEQALIAFSTTMGGAEKAQKFLYDLGKFAATTPFDFPGLVEAAKRLTAVGYTGEQVIPIMRALGDATAAMGTGSEGVERATRALQQMATKGRVTGEEMLQLVEAGIPAWDALAAKLGVDVVKAQEMVTNKQVKVNEIVGAIESYAGPAMQRVKGMMDAQSHSFQGLLSTIKDTMQQLSGTVMAPFFELMVSGMQKLTDKLTDPAVERWAQRMADGMRVVINYASDFLRPVFETLGDALPVVFEKFVDFASQLADWASGLWDAIEPGVSAVVDFLQEVLPPAFEFAAEVATEAFSLISEGVSFFVDMVTTGVGYAVDGVVLLYNAFVDTFGPLVEFVTDAALSIYDALSYINPFAEHSPSIVSQVQEGSTAIQEAYGQTASSVSTSLAGLHGTVIEMTEVLGENTKASRDAKAAQEDIIKAFGANAYEVYQDSIDQLDKMKTRYEELGDAIDKTKGNISELKDKFDAAKDAFNEFKDAQMAEELPYLKQGKELQRQMDEIKLKILQLKQQGPLTQEIIITEVDKTGKVKTKTDKVDTAIGAQVKALEDQLEALGLKAEEIDLLKKLNIEPLKDQLKAIEDGASGAGKALTFEEIKAGMLANKQVMTETSAEIKAQEGLLKEQEKAYKQLGGEIKAQEGALRDFTQAAKDASGAMEKAEKAATAAAGGGGGGKSGVSGLSSSTSELKDKMTELNSKMDETKTKIDEAKSKTSNLKKAQDEVKTASDHGTESQNRFATAFGNLGRSMAPAVEAISDFMGRTRDALEPLEPFMRMVGDSAARFKELRGPMKEVGSSLKELLDSLKEVALAVWEVLSSSAALKTFGVVLAAILLALKAHLDIFRNYLMLSFSVLADVIELAAKLIKAALDVIKGVLNVFIGLFTGDWDRMWKGIKQIVSAEWDAIKAVFQFAFDVIKETFEFFYNTLNDLTGGKLGALKDKIADIWGGVKDFFNGTKSFFTDTVPEWFARMKEKLSDLWDAVKTKVENIWNGIKDFFGGIKDFFTDTIPGWFTSLKDKIAKLWQDLKEVTEKLWGDVKAFFEGIKDFFTDTIPGWFGDLWDEVKGLWNTLQTETEDIWNGVKDFFTNTIWGFISDTIPGWFGDLKDKIGGVWDSLRDITTNAWNGLKDGILSAVNGIIGVINGMIGALNSLHISIPGVHPPDWTHLPGWDGIDIRPSIPSIPYLARGARAFAGGLAVVGELGPELVKLPRGADVIPTSGISSVLRSSSDFNVNRPTRQAASTEARHVGVNFHGPVTINAQNEVEAEHSARLFGWAIINDMNSRGAA